MFCIAHKPRSGKSITILSICVSLLESGRKRILIMTSVPATIKSFTDDLDKYISFRNIKKHKMNLIRLMKILWELLSVVHNF